MRKVIFEVIRDKAPFIGWLLAGKLARDIEARLIETCWHTPTTMFSQSEITRAAE